jgi:hypothetical protein
MREDSIKAQFEKDKKAFMVKMSVGTAVVVGVAAIGGVAIWQKDRIVNFFKGNCDKAPAKRWMKKK